MLADRRFLTTATFASFSTSKVQGVGQTQGYMFGVDDIMFRIVAPGDTDGNGEFNSTDLFAILDAGKFNHPELGAATWGEGDFTGDDLVNSDDLFAMLGAAKFNAGPYTTATPPAALATVPEPSSFVLAALGLVALLACARRHGTAGHRTGVPSVRHPLGTSRSGGVRSRVEFGTAR